MKKVTVRLDEPVHAFFARLAAERQVSLSQLMNETLARFVAAEQSFEMIEARAARARPGAMRQVLDWTAAHGLVPLHPEDALPSDVDRRLLS
jgi:predicted transcriptional regulator